MTRKKIMITIIDNVKTLFWALLIALIIRSLVIQPFYIPSSSMEPTLLIGDRIFVTKYNIISFEILIQLIVLLIAI